MKRLQSIDILRGIACLAVLIVHIPRCGNGAGLWCTVAFLPLEFGYLGVPLFLLISGFCIHAGAARYIALGEKTPVNWGAFWRRRFWRLYPPYLAAIALSVVAFYAVDVEGMHKIVNLPWDLATHLLMIHNLFADYEAGLGNGPFWTLALEEQLYALYALYLLLRKRLPPARILLIAGFIALAWRLSIPIISGLRVGEAPLEFGLWHAWPFGFWAFWIAGALAAEAHEGAIRLPDWCYRWRVMWTGLAAGALVSPYSLGRVAGSNWIRTALPPIAPSVLQYVISVLDPALFAVGFFVLLCKWTRDEARKELRVPGADLWARLGVMCYSLYLTHTPVLRLLEYFMPIRATFAGTFARYALYLPISVIAAAGFFWLVERRFLKAPQRRMAATTSPAV